jgi:hypothetical protein
VTQGIVDIHGKSYRTVAYRVNEFRENHPVEAKWAIRTELVVHDEHRVVMKAAIIDSDGVVVGTGHAEEVRKTSAINRTSAMEVAETSSVGRALAACGLGGEEYASADEVLRAMEQQSDTIEDIDWSMDESPIRTQNDVAEESERTPGDIAEENEMTEVREDRNINIVKLNIQALINIIGEESYKVWHDRVLSNFYGVDSIGKLSADELVDFADKQEIKIKEHKE